MPKMSLDTKSKSKTKSKSSETVISKLREYLRIKMEIDRLEKEAKELYAIAFKDPELLPVTIVVDDVQFTKQYRNPIIPVTTGMIEDSGLDPKQIMPVASFSMTLVKQVYGLSGENKIKGNDKYQEELDMKEGSYFYKKK